MEYEYSNYDFTQTMLKIIAFISLIIGVFAGILYVFQGNLQFGLAFIFSGIISLAFFLGLKVIISVLIEIRDQRDEK